ncbi:hypothetical protein NDU88_003687 [Pleurodeles waltl]|uniref:Uncharacterized protein n=1 Tax=Pleurodeles waltl TaxID=8319 RepID=A0AAV7NH44_PLEWA|nr:hypothetical protein NDU88_003687 [Pleurodeles waltl]
MPRKFPTLGLLVLGKRCIAIHWISPTVPTHPVWVKHVKERALKVKRRLGKVRTDYEALDEIAQWPEMTHPLSQSTHDLTDRIGIQKPLHATQNRLLPNRNESTRYLTGCITLKGTSILIDTTKDDILAPVCDAAPGLS